MTIMFSNSRSNDLSGTVVTDEYTYLGRVAGEQQPPPVRNLLAAVEENGLRKRRRSCSVAENRILMK